jgi:hypothetical protein
MQEKDVLMSARHSFIIYDGGVGAMFGWQKSFVSEKNQERHAISCWCKAKEMMWRRK